MNLQPEVEAIGPHDRVTPQNEQPGVTWYTSPPVGGSVEPGIDRSPPTRGVLDEEDLRRM